MKVFVYEIEKQELFKFNLIIKKKNGDEKVLNG